jgi:uroporphyrin-III C-methyltransferase
MRSQGFVSLVGAGPGDPDLITVKGLRRLRAADVVVYDALVSRELLDECRSDAERIYVGKRGGKHHSAQDRIHEILIDRAGRGLSVVRLKGGDPFVFGRGGEEAEALQNASIDWEVVPGVSAAVSVPAYAGIPVTHRAHASSVAIVTGHEDPLKPDSQINWQALAQGIDTLVFLMGAARLAGITQQLLDHGRSPDTPAAVVRWGTTADQHTVTGTLATIADNVARAQITSPATLIVGDVVRLREKLAWFDVLASDDRRPTTDDRRPTTDDRALASHEALSVR